MKVRFVPVNFCVSLKIDLCFRGSKIWCETEVWFGLPWVQNLTWFGVGLKLSLLFSLVKNIKRAILSAKAVDSPHLLKQPSFEPYHQNNLSSNYYSL